ncbi:hypothetical protein GCM10027087_36450 [Paractinoplanes abujensis]
MVAGATPAAAHPSAPATKWPTTLTLPAGFQPEGIAIGDKPYAYFGSRVDGDIYKVSLRTGKGSVLSEGPGAGNPSLGLKIDNRDRLFVAGGSAGSARVVDLRSGRVLKSYTLKTPGSTAWFVNDVVLTRDAAWFTDSANPVLWKVPLNLRSAPVAVPLTGDIQYTTGNNANGISRTPDGRALIVVQSNLGKLFKVGYDGRSTEIKLGTETVVNGDGLWLRGRTLYVVQNRLNVIAEVALDKRATEGRVVSRTGSAAFDVPTTIAEYGTKFYLPNARFTTPAEPATTYNAVAVPIP